MNKFIRKLCNISSYPHFALTMLCRVLQRQTAVYWPRGQQLYHIPPLPPHRGGRWTDSLGTRAYNEGFPGFPKVCEDFTITEKAPSKGLLRDYEPLDGSFSSWALWVVL